MRDWLQIIDKEYKLKAMSVFIQCKKTCFGRAITFAIRMQFFVATLALITLAVAVRGEQGESDGQAQRDYVSIPT